ncbi:hypothetical protein [Spirosoma sp.]|uniref:hypothetical protein n=1 Tax=Spirosoma sp. TaxID=1899569 RepID=UPI00261CFB5F|nr:hypothetical protein [Spirosoma sp.]MCX6213039.1 hypothetical protein [Spirosoma sp.]
MNKKATKAVVKVEKQVGQAPDNFEINPGWKITAGKLIRLHTGENSKYYEQY